VWYVQVCDCAAAGITAQTTHDKSGNITIKLPEVRLLGPAALDCGRQAAYTLTEWTLLCIAWLTLQALSCLAT
jgi:hypothetical protein